MAVDVGGLEIFMGPSELGAPDNLEEVIVGFIGRARSTLDIAVQELESVPIAEAIMQSRASGVRVRVILERDYLTVTRAAADPWQPGGKNEANRRIHGALLRARVQVITDLNPNIFHQKFIVSDAATRRAAVLTGSTNFTPTGTAENLNHIVIIRGKRTATVYSKEFAELWSGTFGQKRERHDPSPRTYRVSKVRVKVLFAPDHAPEMEIMKQMLKAKERIDFAIFTFAQSSGIDDTMIALAGAGISVRGILDRMQGGQRWAATTAVRDAGAEVYVTRGGEGLNKLHHKLMVIDSQVVIAGSFNYTNPATALNDENIVVIGDLGEENAEARERQSQIGQFAQAEIARIIDRHG